jgi:glycosyltransferase involved in cell wall biosynthesis
VAPRIALLTGGGDRPYALGLAHSLVEAGIAFDFIGSDFLEDPLLRQSPGVRFLNLRGDMRPGAPIVQRVLRVLLYYARLVAYAAASEAKVFHVLWNNKFEYFDRTLLLLYYRLLRKRVAYTVHNVNIRERDSGDSFLNRLTLRVQYRLADHLFVHTERMKRELESGFGVPGGKVSVIPFGINNTVPLSSLTGEQARRRLGLDASHKVLLFFGNIAPYKGLDHLVRAFSVVAQDVPECRLIIAGRQKGSEAYWTTVSRMIDSLHLGERILQRIEYVPDDDIETYFKAADVLVLPYTHVFQSGVLFLGYFFGLPVVATDIASIKEDVIEGRTGYLCTAGDPGSIARAILATFAGRMLEDREAVREFIKAYAEDRYSWSKVAAITKAVYAAMLPATNREAGSP